MCSLCFVKSALCVLRREGLYLNILVYCRADCELLWGKLYAYDYMLWSLSDVRCAGLELHDLLNSKWNDVGRDYCDGSSLRYWVF